MRYSVACHATGDLHGVVIWDSFIHTTCNYMGFYHSKYGVYFSMLSRARLFLDCFDDIV